MENSHKKHKNNVVNSNANTVPANLDAKMMADVQDVMFPTKPLLKLNVTLIWYMLVPLKDLGNVVFPK